MDKSMDRKSAEPIVDAVEPKQEEPTLQKMNFARNKQDIKNNLISIE